MVKIKYICFCPLVICSDFVLKDFERKSALFSLASSEVLLINLWEHQVGLYQGANMGLLKTVFEVNLGLFGKRNQAGYVLMVSLFEQSLLPRQNEWTYNAIICDSGPHRRDPAGQSVADLES